MNARKYTRISCERLFEVTSSLRLTTAVGYLVV